MLSDSELAQMRDDIKLLLPDTCSILQLTLTSDNAGGWTETWNTVKALVPCRLDYTSPGKENIANANLKPYQTGIVSMGYDETVSTSNRLTISGVTFNVTGVNTGQSWIGVKRVSVEKIP